MYDFQDAENKMPVVDLPEDLHEELFHELHHALLMTRRIEMTALTGKRQEIFMTVVFIFHAGNTDMQIAAIEITIDCLHDVGTPESILM